MAEGENGPTLKLIMEKGPLAGQTRDFRSGSEIKIGRIARGNTVAIKDDGISSKHISVNFDSKPGRVGNWTVSDLGSSNGSFLNGRTLEPFTPAQLSDGDVIKIGEWTSILVKFEDVRVEAEETKVRRNPTRRRGRNLGVVDENNELTLEKDDENKENVRGRIRRGKAALQNNEVAEVKGFNEGEMASSKRVTRSTARNRNGVEGEVGEMENLGRKACSRRNGRKKEQKLDENGVQDAEEMEHLGQNEVQERENCIENEVGMKAKAMQKQSLKRTTRNKKKELNLEILGGNELQNSDAMEMVLPIGAKDGQNVNLRRTTTSLKKEGNLESLGENGGANNKRGRGRRGKRNLGMETFTENDERTEIGKEVKVEEKLNPEREMLEEVKEIFRVKEVLQEGKGLDGLVEEGVQLAAEGCEALASTSGVKENDGNEVDLTKITLGEWFDFLDFHLPKQIIDATEEMISDMRQKAEKFHDFMLQQKNCKGNVELPVN